MSLSAREVSPLGQDHYLHCIYIIVYVRCHGMDERCGIFSPCFSALRREHLTERDLHSRLEKMSLMT
jgi:hypothetical protein